MDEERTVEQQLKEAQRTILVLNERLMIGEVARIREDRHEKMIVELRKSLRAMEDRKDELADEVEVQKSEVRDACACLVDALEDLTAAASAITETKKVIRAKLKALKGKP